MDIPPPKFGLVREIWSRVQGFILPEEIITLKVVFDNVRNYFLCTAVVVAVLAITQKGALGTGVSAANSGFWPWNLQIIGLMLLGGNTLQSWLIISRVTRGIGSLPKTIRPAWGKWRRRAMRFLLIVLVAPFVFAAYQILPTLILWAVTGGSVARTF